jgi:CRP/FNR family transcriptional regulator, anaerobic regulatory protein
VVAAGQATAQLFVVHEGSVKVSKTSRDGRETTLRVLGPGDVLGEVWFLTGGRPDVDAVALEPTRVCVFDHARLSELLARFPEVGGVMLRTLAEKLRAAERMLAARALADVGARVAAYLLELPATIEDGRATVVLPMAKKDVAALLDTSPETLSRRLASFERKGLVRVRGAEVEIIDPDGLDLVSWGA